MTTQRRPRASTPGSAEALCTSMVRASTALGRAKAFAIACHEFAKRLRLRGWPGMPEGEAHPEIDSALRGLDEDSLREPARVLGVALEAALEAERAGRGHARKRLGAYHTPEWLVQHVLDTAMEPPGPERTSTSGTTVLDPACGSGVFLVAAARRGKAGAAIAAYGIDIDPVAAMLARFSLWVESGGTLPLAELQRRIVCADALLVDVGSLWPSTRFDAVVGNPPFLNQLERGTAHDRARAAALRERFGDIARCYADAAAVFLELGVRSVRPGGRVAMVQPQSVLSSRDAAPVRRSVLERGCLTDLWATREQAFGASVLVCVPTVHIGGRSATIRRRMGKSLDTLPDATLPPAELLAAETWSPLLAPMHGIPEFSVAREGCIGDMASATADFRDQFYGLRGRIVEDAGVSPDEKRLHPLLVTTGLIDPALCRWGERSTRIDGRAWERPRLALRLLAEDPELLRWARARLVPKVLLATQTRVLEAAVDAAGEWVPVTPLITVVPRQGGEVWKLAAALCSPVLSAWALRQYAGAGLSASAIKLSAKQVMRLPVPANDAAWREAASSFRAAAEHRAAEDLHESGRLICEAYGLSARTSEELIAWWSDRLPKLDQRPAQSR